MRRSKLKMLRQKYCIWIPPTKSGLGNQREFSVSDRCWIWHLTCGVLFFTIYSIISLHETDLLLKFPSISTASQWGSESMAQQKPTANMTLSQEELGHRCHVMLAGAQSSASRRRRQVRLPPCRRDGHAWSCRDKLSSALRLVMDNGMASATVKISHKALPPPLAVVVIDSITISTLSSTIQRFLVTV